uniref:RRM domain-containing protein n=1 Tax=Setaria italica TaxID=4555 RepID=K3YAN4_SETIT
MNAARGYARHQNRNDLASRLSRTVAPISLAPSKGAAMAMAALRGASRCLASGGSPAAVRPMLLAHSRGITYKLFIGGLSQFATEDTLAEAFSRYGQVIEATIVTDKMTDKPKGFGFVKFASQEEANTAREEMNGKAGF